jgi:serine/threonine protein kinase
MGEVYRARDTKLKREVAVKILPDEFSRDADRVSRFQREAEALAALNHQNIGTIYDIQQIGETRFLILELVEGETLQERLRQGPIPVDETLLIAKQIAEALEAAHERGVVHRDLKPANIKLTPDGKVKVLDFGLAKALQPQSQTVLSHSPTLMSASMPGAIVGTAAYMSPEQIKGRQVDRRTDIFAFGCVLYEMLTAKAAFDGDDVTEILGAVLKTEPDWSKLPENTPSAVQKLLRLCLQKDPKKRRSDAADVRIDIEEALSAPSAADLQEPQTTRNSLWMKVSMAVAVAVILALAIPAARYWREIPPDAPEMRLQIMTPPTSSPLDFALSPDGRALAFVASGDGPPRLWLRTLDSVTAGPLAGTETAEFPFWSSDNQSIGFFAEGRLKRIDVRGGPPQTLAAAPTGFGGTWNRDGIILYVPVGVGGIFRTTGSGGDGSQVTQLTAGQSAHRFPRFLPDGHHFVFFVLGTPEQQGIYLASLDGGNPKRLVANDAAGAWAPPDRLLFIRQGALMSQRVDINQGVLVGDAVSLANPVGSDNAFSGSGFSVSTTGIVAYRASESGRRQFLWYDRSGKITGRVGEADESNLMFPELSPDDRKVVFARSPEGNLDIWVTDVITNATTRFTLGGSNSNTAIFSPDGKRIVFQSNRNGPFDLFWKPSNGGNEEVLLKSADTKSPFNWSPGGEYLLYRSVDSKTGYDLWILPMTGNQKPTPVLNSRFDETLGQFSPDGRWIAYQSNKSGRFQVYVQPFPITGAEWPISINGGTQPRWSPDGKQLFFIAPDLKMMSAGIKPTGSAIEVAPPVALFQTRIVNSFSQIKQQYAVAHDGRFLINTAQESSASPITVILNWKPK